MPKKLSVKKKKKSDIPLAVVALSDRLAMLYRTNTLTAQSLYFSWSQNGVDFLPDKKKVSLKISPKKNEKIKNCQNFSISVIDNGFLMTYTRVGKKTVSAKSKKTNGNIIVLAHSKDFYEWKVISELPAGDCKQAVVAQDKQSDQFELYRDGLFVKNQSSKTPADWKNESVLLFTSRPGMFDSEKISIIGSLVTEKGILLLYDVSVQKKLEIMFQVGGVLFDKNNPRHITWRAPAPLWQGVAELKKSSGANSVGFVHFKERFIVYWTTDKGELILGTFPSLFKSVEIEQYKILKKFEKNPIIKPRPGRDWEIQGTFNPGVFQDENMVHMFYRAIGGDGISRIGYASSKDGLHFVRTLTKPVFEPSFGFGLPHSKISLEPMHYHPGYYTSGGGWGGSEDPKVVKIGDRIYMLYVAFEGWGSVRIALTSISVEDFRAGKWNWKKPILISPPGKVNKNWVLFPEKINGKFVILHSIVPKVMVEYVDDLDNFKKYIDSPRAEGPQPGRENSWDNLLRGAGAPPIKTDIGWLLLYHAIDKRETGKYKLGAMILDLKDPTKILYRSAHPILYPEMWYENEGKPGIVYASGATVIGDNLFVYYGGGDRVVCMAETPLKDFLNYLVSGKPDNYELSKIFVPVI